MTAPGAARPRILVDLVADPVCPWCYVGLKSFQAARDRLSDQFQILPRLRAYQLNPDTPAGGVDRAAYYEKKFPDEKQRQEIALSLKAAAAGAGFKFDPTIPTRLPNTLLAHQLIRFSHFDGAQERVADALYAAYWNDDADIGKAEILQKIGESAGLDGASINADFADEKSRREITSEADAFRRAGVTGVPTFIINERTGFSGALPPPRLAEAMQQAAQHAA